VFKVPKKKNVPGKLKGWEFDDIDLAREEELNDTEVVLKALPKKLFICANNFQVLLKIGFL
jgi:hypothetical protein